MWGTYVNINEKVYMRTSTANNYSKHISVDADITYWGNTGRYMNIQYARHKRKHMKIMQHIYQK
jgi:hypothetical protein